MAITLPDDAPINVQVKWVDAHGHAAVVDGPTTWASSDATVMTVVSNATTSTQATISAGTGNLGSAQLTASADANLGTGVQNITAMADVTVVAGTAVAGTIEVVPPIAP